MSTEQQTAKDLRGRSAAELTAVLAEQKAARQKLQMLQVLGQLAKPHELKRVKKDIARIATVISEQAKQTGEGR